jgi:ubiquinone/menaquinone biosynthesis C-methylase UbiE
MKPNMSSVPPFDPVKFKETTRKQWDSAADAWDRWSSFLESWLGPATEAMLDMAEIKSGSRVLDVAAGAGGQTLAAARRVGAAGSVVATDISPGILDRAAHNAKEGGFANVQTEVVDGEEMNFQEGSFDAAISRVGLIYFPDQQRALKAILRALRPGGKFATVTYSTPEKNGFFSVPIGIIRRRVNLPPPAPGQPGPFSLGADGVLQDTLSQAGFRDVRVVKVSSPIRMQTAAECTRFERESFGALHQMLSSLEDEGKNAAWTEIEVQLGAFQQEKGFEAPCELLVGCGTK